MLTKEEARMAYDQLVQFRRSQPVQRSIEFPGRVETHHIIPISCGGSDDYENKIEFLAKEHFMAHVYLWVIHHDDEFHNQMTCALSNMIKGTLTGIRAELRDFILSSEEYQKAREEHAKYMSESIGEKVSGKKNGAFGKHWYYDPITLSSTLFYETEVPTNWIPGKIHSKDFNKKVSESSKDRVWICMIDETKQCRVKISEVKKWLATGQWKLGHLKYDSSIVERRRQKNFERKQERLNKRIKECDLTGVFPAKTSIVCQNVVDRKFVWEYFNAKELEHHCAKCGKKGVKFVLHAKDGNCRNLAIDNYEILCRECYLNSGTAGFSGRHYKLKS